MEKHIVKNESWILASDGLYYHVAIDIRDDVKTIYVDGKSYGEIK